MRIRSQFGLIIGAFIALVCLTFSLLEYAWDERMYLRRIDTDLFAAANFNKAMLPDDYHDRITGPNSVSKDAFDRIVDRNNRLCRELNLQYLWSVMVVDGKIVFTTSTSPSKDVRKQDHAKFFEVHRDPASFSGAFDSMKVDYSSFHNEWGHGRQVLVPFRDSHGRKYCFGASVSVESVYAQLRQGLFERILLSGVILAAAWAVTYFISRSLSRPIVELTAVAHDIAMGNYQNTPGVRGPTEIKSLSQSLDNMRQAIREKVDALRESESRYRRIVETANEGIWAIDQRFVTTFVNRRMAEMLGYQVAQMVGQPITNFMFERDIPAHEDRMAERQRGMSGFYEQRFRCSDGSERWMVVSAAPLTDQDGQFAGSFAMVTDITDRKRAEENVRALNAELEDRVRQRTAELETANKELEAFSYSVSHDLIAPLRGIDGFSRSVLEKYADKLDDQGRDWLNRIRAAAQRMAQLIDDLLKLSRLARSELRRSQVDLSAMVESIGRELAASEPERNVEFIVAPGVLVEADPDLIRIAMDNLLRNAWKFTSKHPAARIEFGTQMGNDSMVYFIRDDGAGFDQAYAGRLFGAFQRLHGVREFDGTGIGLAIVHRIITRHKGRVWAQGEVEKGATFYFTLPC